MSNLPSLPSFELIRERLERIFPESFPDRRPLTNEMAVRTFFVAMYGGYIARYKRYFRPSTVIRFSMEQAVLTSDADRLAWVSTCQNPGFAPLGKQWYADNTREPLRDDLIRNRAIPVGAIIKREGVAPTSPAPIYALSDEFAALLSPDLSEAELNEAITRWHEEALDPMTLKRMRLLAQGVTEKEGQIHVTLPTTHETLRLAAGEASIITRDVCQELSVRLMKRPVVVHLSMSDQKTFDLLTKKAAAFDLEFDTSGELPDVVIVDLEPRSDKVAFIEVVHSDGAMTELRKQAFLKIAARAGISPEKIMLVTAFEDRNTLKFKQRFSELAVGSMVWFRSEPDFILKLDSLLKSA